MPSLMSRREATKALGLGALAVSLGSAASARAGEKHEHRHDAGDKQKRPADAAAPGPYEMAPLPYDFGALAPVLNEQIVRLHYSKHTAGYFKGLNAALEQLEQARGQGDFSRIRALSRDLAFNGSGAVLHTIYWSSLTPGGPAEPEGRLRDGIDRDFGSFDACRNQLLEAAGSVQGSGWSVLAYEPFGGRLVILQAENHEDQTIWGVRPLLVIDAWEHAYYLQYENRRDEYLRRIATIIDWPAVAARYEAALRSI